MPEIVWDLDTIFRTTIRHLPFQNIYCKQTIFLTDVNRVYFSNAVVIAQKRIHNVDLRALQFYVFVTEYNICSK